MKVKFQVSNLVWASVHLSSYQAVKMNRSRCFLRLYAARFACRKLLCAATPLALDLNLFYSSCECFDLWRLLLVISECEKWGEKYGTVPEKLPAFMFDFLPIRIRFNLMSDKATMPPRTRALQ